MWTNFYRSFLHFSVLETRLSDFHKLIVTGMKKHVPNQRPKIINYRDFRNFSESEYRKQILYELSILGSVYL